MQQQEQQLCYMFPGSTMLPPIRSMLNAPPPPTRPIFVPPFILNNKTNNWNNLNSLTPSIGDLQSQLTLYTMTCEGAAIAAARAAEAGYHVR